MQTPPAPSSYVHGISGSRTIRSRSIGTRKFKREEPAVEVRPLEENGSIRRTYRGKKRHHFATPHLDRTTGDHPARNGELGHAMSTQEEKRPAEKSVTPPKQEVLQFEPVTRGRFEKKRTDNHRRRRPRCAHLSGGNTLRWKVTQASCLKRRSLCYFINSSTAAGHSDNSNADRWFGNGCRICSNAGSAILFPRLFINSAIFAPRRPAPM